MEKYEKDVIQAVVELLKTTLGEMPCSKADKITERAIDILDTL